MAGLPEKVGKERREGPYREQNPRGNRKRIGKAYQDHGKGALGGPHEGETEDLSQRPSLPRPMVTTPVTSLPPKHFPPHESRPKPSENLAGKAVEGGVIWGVSGWDICFNSWRENRPGIGVRGFGDQARWTKEGLGVLAFCCYTTNQLKPPRQKGEEANQGGKSVL